MFKLCYIIKLYIDIILYYIVNLYYKILRY